MQIAIRPCCNERKHQGERISKMDLTVTDKLRTSLSNKIAPISPDFSKVLQILEVIAAIGAALLRSGPAEPNKDPSMLNNLVTINKGQNKSAVQIRHTIRLSHRPRRPVEEFEEALWALTCLTTTEQRRRPRKDERGGGGRRCPHATLAAHAPGRSGEIA